MRTISPLLFYILLLLSMFSFSLYGKNKISFTETPADLIEEVNRVDLSPLKTVFNTAYIEDYGAIANDSKDDGTAIQLAVDANVSGSVNYIKSRTGGKFIIANGSINLDGVNNLYFQLHPNAEVIATGNFPAFTSIFNTTSGDVSVSNIVFDGFAIGSEYDANANGGKNGSKGGNHYGTRIVEGADPNPLNPAVIWMGGVQLDGFTFKNMKATNPFNNGYFIKLHNESGTAFTKNVIIDNNKVNDLGGMFVEIANHANPLEYRWENITFTNNIVDNIGIFNHGMAISLSGTGRGANIFGNKYSNLYIGVELLGANDVNWRDDIFFEGVDHFWSFSKNFTNDTAPNKNIIVNNITGQYATLSPSIVENVQNSTFSNVSMLGGGNDRIEVRHSKDVSFINTKIIGTGFGLFNFTGTHATNTQANENIQILNPDLHGVSIGGNPLLTGGGDQLGDVTISEGQLLNDVGPLWIANGSTAEPKYENVYTEINGVKVILNPKSNGNAGKVVASSSIEFTEAPIELIAADSVEVTVNYTILDPSAYVLVRLENPNGDNPQKYVKKSGTGSHTFTIPVPESSGDGYQWVAQLLSTDESWSGLAHQFVEGVNVSSTEPISEPNGIEFTEAPIELTAGDSVEVTVNYTISDPDAFVLIRLDNPNGDNPQKYVKKSETGSHTFSIAVPESSGEGYQWVAQLLSTDGSWAGLAHQFVKGVTVEVSEREEEDSITLTATPSQLAQGKSYDIAFNYSFNGRRWVQAWMTSKAVDAKGNWVKIAQATKQFDSGTGNDALSIQITGEPLNRNLLFIQVFEVISVNGRNRWSLVHEKRVDNIDLEDKNSTAKELSISPNPFNNSFTYNYNIQKHGAVLIELFSIYGLKVKTIKQIDNHEAGRYSDTVDATDLDSGIYILRIKSSSGNEEKRLIKN